MKCRLLLILLLAGSAAAQEISTAIVPVVGSVFGSTMVRWKTDVELVNDTGGATDVALELPLAPGLAEFAVTMSPGQSIRFPDIAQAFSLDHVLSPLRVTTSGRRSVTVRATAYAIRQNGEISPTQSIGTVLGSPYYPTRILDGLAFSEEFRTNIGLVNFNERDADFVLALQRIPGRTLAVSRYRVHAGGMAHLSIQSLFPLISEGSGFSVVVETGARDTYVYASVIESANHSGRYVNPRVGVR